MDMKKKLEDAYKPDNQTRKERVLVALTGGIDSFVTAYLLKIQKYDLVAATVLNSWDEENLIQEKNFSCFISQPKTDAIKGFCHRLGIPLQIVKASAEFKESVIEPFMAAKALGKNSRPCWDCHELRMNLLHDKMKEVGATKLATGHYAKLFHHEAHNSVFVHTSNDESNDQSALLSRLSHDVLKDLLLPLSDLTKKEVLKLAENFGLTGEDTRIKMHSCLPASPELNSVLSKKLPKKLVKEGEITNFDGTLNLAPHEGVHTRSFGEPFEYRENGKPIKGIIGDYSYSEKRLTVVDVDYFERDKILLVKCRFSEEVSLPEPIKGFAVLSDGRVEECWIHPKTLSSVCLEFNEKFRFLSGEILSVQRKKGKNSKVLLTGEVRLLVPEKTYQDEEDAPPVSNPVSEF